MGLLARPSPFASGPQHGRGLHPECSRRGKRPGRRTLDNVEAKCCTGGEIRVAIPLETWVDEAANLAKPDRVVYCDGSEAEYQRMIGEMLRGGETYTLNEKTYPNCYLHRSSPNDVARTEHLTYICSPEKEDAGPTNNWMDPGAAKHKVGAGLDGRTHADPGAGVAGRQSDVHGRGFSERMWKDEPGDDGVRAGGPGLPRLDGGRRYLLDENRRGRIFARDQSGSRIFWRGSGYGNENQSKRNGSAAQEHVIYECGDDFGTGAVVGRNWQRGAGRADQLEGRGMGSVQRSGSASECAVHRAGKTVSKYFAEVGSAGRGADFSVHFWGAESTSGAAGVRIV